MHLRAALAHAQWVLLVFALGQLVIFGAGDKDLVVPLNEEIRPSEVVHQIEKLATFSDAEGPAVTRVLFSKSDTRAREYIVELMKEAGLQVRSDPMGNIFGRWEGTEKDAPVVMTGSHTDAIPMSGKYDGTVGVLGAIHALHVLRQIGFQPKNPIEVVMFTSEEPTRFQLSCLGSRAVSGTMTSRELESKTDADGVPFLDAAKDAGYGANTTSALLLESAPDPWGIACFIELHIEQGPLLEEQNLDIGLVTAIAAPATIRVSFSGDGGHAGAQLMHYRNDAGLAAAELALFVEQTVLSTGSVDSVGTTGKISIEPNAVNSVPRKALIEIDIRDVDLDRRDMMVHEVLDQVARIGDKRKLRHNIEMINKDPPAKCSPQVISELRRASDMLDLRTIEMVSRAYHDSLFMARVTPTSMIFIPCQDGISHRPDEYASEEAIGKGVRLLALTLANIAGPNRKNRQVLDTEGKKEEL